jgi:VanZ family protein
MIIKKFWKSLLVIAGILVISLLPDNSPETQTPSFLSIALDKWEHVLAYCVLAISLIIELKKQAIFNNLIRHAVLYSLLFSLALGGLIELLQKFFPSLNRSANLKDIIANGIGIILAVILYFVVRNKKLPFIGQLTQED